MEGARGQLGEWGGEDRVVHVHTYIYTHVQIPFTWKAALEVVRFFHLRALPGQRQPTIQADVSPLW